MSRLSRHGKCQSVGVWTRLAKPRAVAVLTQTNHLILSFQDVHVRSPITFFPIGQAKGFHFWGRLSQNADFDSLIRAHLDLNYNSLEFNTWKKKCKKRIKVFDEGLSPQYQFVKRWTLVNHGMSKGGFEMILASSPKKLVPSLGIMKLEVWLFKIFGEKIFRWPEETLWSSILWGGFYRNLQLLVAVTVGHDQQWLENIQKKPE